MLEKNLIKLEYNKILEILSNSAETKKGKELCMSLKPNNNREKIIKLQKETTDMTILLERKGIPPINNIDKIDEYILLIKNERFLSIKGIFNIRKTTKKLKSIKRIFL